MTGRLECFIESLLCTFEKQPRVKFPPGLVLTLQRNKFYTQPPQVFKNIYKVYLSLCRPRKHLMKVYVSVQTKLKDEGTTNGKAGCFLRFES